MQPFNAEQCTILPASHCGHHTLMCALPAEMWLAAGQSAHSKLAIAACHLSYWLLAVCAGHSGFHRATH
jgi:hypothetical protein